MLFYNKPIHLLYWFFLTQFKVLVLYREWVIIEIISYEDNSTDSGCKNHKSILQYKFKYKFKGCWISLKDTTVAAVTAGGSCSPKPVKAKLHLWQVLLWHGQESLITLASVSWEKTFEVQSVASCTSKDQLTGWWRGLSCVCLAYISPGHRRLLVRGAVSMAKIKIQNWSISSVDWNIALDTKPFSLM